LREVRCAIVDAAEFNDALAIHGNKSALLFSRVAELMRVVWRGFGRLSPTVFIDRQGGRKKYMRVLMNRFPECGIMIRREGKLRSAYDIAGDGMRMTVSFEVNGDSARFPVALASMLSKYIRELHMELFNDFWSRRKSDLRRTAGYPQDAARFLREISGLCEELGIDLNMMVRKR